MGKKKINQLRTFHGNIFSYRMKFCSPIPDGCLNYTEYDATVKDGGGLHN